MGFLGLFKRDKKEEKQESREETLKISEIEDWLAKTFSSDIDVSRREMINNSKKIVDEISKIKNQLKVLDKAEFEKEDKRYSPVNMIKNTFVTKTSSSIKTVNPLNGNTGERDILDFVGNVEKIIKEIKTMSPKQTVMLSKFFKKQAFPIFNAVKVIEGNTENIKSSMKNQGPFRLSLLINEKVNEYGNTEKQIDTLNILNTKTIEEIKKTKEHTDSLKNDMIRLESSEDYMNIKNASEDLDQLKKKKKELELDMVNELSPIKKPLKKIQHDADLTKDEKNLLETIISSESVFQADREKIKKAMNLVDNIIREKQAQLKQSEKEKIHEFKSKIDSFISDMISKKEKIENDMTTKKQILKENKLFEKRQDIKEAVERNEERIRDLEKEKEKNENDMNRLKTTKEKLKDDIKKMVLDNTNTTIILQ